MNTKPDGLITEEDVARNTVKDFDKMAKHIKRQKQRQKEKQERARLVQGIYNLDGLFPGLGAKK